MSSKYVYICDKCKREVDFEDKITADISFGFDGGKNAGSFKKYYLKSSKIDLCPECASKIGIVEKAVQDIKSGNTQSVQDRLYDIISEIVSDVMQS